jgi:hypothetical protein
MLNAKKFELEKILSELLMKRREIITRRLKWQAFLLGLPCCSLANLAGPSE